ncbi:MAG: HAD-IIA family hydrolase [Thermoflexales bacterium]|nr:HAD-IIA family hydrolase [Thermoflexales bacterium]
MVKSSTPLSRLGTIRGLISDMDGVLWRGNQPMPGLVDFVSFLRQAGIRLILATNNASKRSADYVERLAGFGVTVPQDEISCTAEAAAEHLAALSPGARAFVIGEPALESALAERGLVIVPEEAVPLGVKIDKLADYVIVGWNRRLTWEKLTRATLLIRGGACFVGTNADRTWPSEYGLLPGNGATLAFLQAATDVEPMIIGKPGQIVFEQAMKRLGLEAAQVAMLGDRLETDIEGGQRAGLTTIFVCSGVQSRAEAERYPNGPDLIFEDISDLMQAWKTRISATETHPIPAGDWRTQS